MAPVDPQAANSLTLGPVLDLIERAMHGPDAELAIQELLRVLPMVRALADRHAAQLRQVSLETWSAHERDTQQAVANFLSVKSHD